MTEFQQPTAKWELPVALIATAGLLGNAAVWSALGSNVGNYYSGEASDYMQTFDTTCSIEHIEYDQLPMGPGQYALSMELAVDGLNGLAENNLKYAATIVRSEVQDSGDIVAQGQDVHGMTSRGQIAWENSSHATVYFDPGDTAGTYYSVSLGVEPFGDAEATISSQQSIDCGAVDFVLEQQDGAMALVKSDSAVVCARTLGKLMRVSAENVDGARYIRLSDDQRRISTCGD